MGKSKQPTTDLTVTVPQPKKRGTRYLLVQRYAQANTPTYPVIPGCRKSLIYTAAMTRRLVNTIRDEINKPDKSAADIAKIYGDIPPHLHIDLALCEGTRKTSKDAIAELREASTANARRLMQHLGWEVTAVRQQKIAGVEAVDSVIIQLGLPA